ncbi:MAG TPA: DUF3631 domain-containing protein, partial [Actinomycetota bacterium]
AREASVALNGIGRGLDATTIGVQLLADIESIFTAKGVDRVSSEDLVIALHGVEESSWDWLNKNILARRLRPFGIRPTKIRIGDRTLQGYHLDLFADAFRRYLLKNGTTGTSGTPQVAATRDVPDFRLWHPTKGKRRRWRCPSPTEEIISALDEPDPDPFDVPTPEDPLALAEAIGFPEVWVVGCRINGGRGAWDWDAHHVTEAGRLKLWRALEEIGRGEVA